MYRVKEAGGGLFAAYHPSMHDELVQRLELAVDLRRALERDELAVHYQPTVDPRTGAIAAGDLAETVAEVLAGTGMPSDRLVLEMTESVLLTGTDENLACIVGLKALGVQLAMDDFGTGYSSLAYLRRFPMDVLKVDRSFVDRLGGASEDEALVRTIVRLGQRFGMDTVAEGIEDATQLAILREMGCDYAQGFFLSRPLPAADAGRLLDEGLPARAFA